MTTPARLRWPLVRLAVLVGLLSGAVLGGLLGGWLGGASPARAQASVQVVIDAPADGAVTGPELTVRGWASGTATATPGVDGVDGVAVYLDGQGEDRGQLLGTATYGIPRPDVVALLGDARLENVGYELRVALPPGEHRLAVYAQARGAPEGEDWSSRAAVAVTIAAPATAAAPGSAPRAAGSPGPAAPPGVAGGTVCTNRAASGTCLAYTAANGAVGMVCSEQAPDGECVAYVQSYTVVTACARYGPGGQCLTAGTSPAVNPAPGGPAQTTALCLEYNAVGQCNRYSGQAVPDPTTLALTAQAAGSVTMLHWPSFPGATTYEVLRCATPQSANCAAVSQTGTTSYALPTRQNFWYAVRARGADGRALVTSNFLGPL